jgi:hypothetical protein
MMKRATETEALGPQIQLRGTGGRRKKAIETGDVRSIAGRHAQEALLGRSNAPMISILETNTFGSAVAKGINRGLEEYLRLLGPRFTHRMLAADASTHFLDLGGGNGVAAKEIAIGGFACSPMDAEPLRTLAARKNKDRPKVTLVSFKPEHSNWPAPARFNPVVGELFEDVAMEKLTKLGTVDIAADFWGVLAYTDRPTEALARLHAMLAVGGECFVRVGPRVFEYQSLTRVKTKSSQHASEVHLGKKKMTFPDWVKTVKGFDVSEDEDGQVLILKKNRDAFAADLLRFDGYVRPDLMPPGRRFVRA